MAIRVARVSSAVKCSEGSTGRPLSNGRAAHAAAATQRTVATPRRAWGRSPPAPLRFLPRRQPRPVFQHRGRPQCYNEVGYGQGGARPSGKVKGSWGGTPSPPRSMDESIEGQKVLVESYEELCYEGSEFRQGKEPLHSEHDIEEQVVLRSMWDLKIPEIDERKQTRKMIQVLGMTSIAAMISNMDKVNMSVAIVPMMASMGWSTTVAGVLQASFFWGYLLAQIPSGRLVARFDGRVVLSVGVICWSLATLMAPACAGVSVALLASTRFLVGFFEATAPSANADLITRWAAIEERSRAVTAVWAGFNVGNIVGLLAAPVCVATLGWKSIFYIFGSLGVLWWAAWMAINRNLPLPCKLALSRHEYVRVGESATKAQRSIVEGLKTKPKENLPIPYGAFFKLPAFWAMNTVHFCENWGKFTLMAWMPVYYRSTLGLSLQMCSVLSILPYVLGILVSTTGASVADSLIKKGWELTTVRKLMQCLASGGAGACMLVCVLASSATVQVASLTAALAMSNLSTVGLYCSHQDISPKYAGVMLSITNTFGSLPGMLGNLLVGTLMDITGSWTQSLLFPCMICYFVSAATWGMLYSSEPVDFDAKMPRPATGAKLAAA